MLIADEGVQKLLRSKARLRAVDNVAFQAADLAIEGTAVVLLSSDGTPLTEAVKVGVAEMKEQALEVQILSSCPGEQFADNPAAWGPVGVRIRALDGAEDLTWSEGEAMVLSTAHAAEGRHRLLRALPTVREAIESHGVAISGGSEPGHLQLVVNGPTLGLHLSRLTPGQQQDVGDALGGFEVTAALKAQKLWLKWLRGGGVEIRSVEVGKQAAVQRDLEARRAGQQPKPKFIFFCDGAGGEGAGDVELARYIKGQGLGMVIATYLPPEVSGHDGTPTELLKLADAITVGRDVADELGISGVPLGSAPGHRTGAFMVDMSVAIGTGRETPATGLDGLSR